MLFAVFRQSDAEILADDFVTKKEAFKWANENLAHLSRDYWYVDFSDSFNADQESNKELNQNT